MAFGFSKKNAGRIADVVKRVERGPINKVRRRDQPVGVSSMKCTPQNAIHHYTILGSPDSGSFDISLSIDGPPETLTFQFDDDAVTFRDQLLTHSEISEGDVIVTGAGFPNATMQVIFQGDLGEKDIKIPTADWNGFAGGIGVGVIVALAQLGIK